jgi:hypothetical protein
MSTQSSCPDRERIFQLVHRLLEPAEESELRRHVLHCEKCLLVARDFEKFDAVLGEWKDQAPSPWFDQRLKQKLPAARPARAFRFFALPSTRIFAAALLVMIVVAGAYVIDELPKPGAKSEVKSSVAEVQKPATPAQTSQKQTAVQSKAKKAPKSLPPEEQIKMYQNMGVLEDFDLLEGFDVLSDLPKGEAKNAH